MIRFEKKNFIYKIYTWLPIIILYVSVLNEFDLNYLNIDYFSFNFPLLSTRLDEPIFNIMILALFRYISYKLSFLFFRNFDQKVMMLFQNFF